MLWLGVLKCSGTSSFRVTGSGFTEYTGVADVSLRLFAIVAIAALRL